MTTTLTASTVSEPTYPEWPRLVGRQEPHHLSEFPGDEEQGEKAIELGRRAGKRSMPWQSSMLRSWMRTRPDGLWTHRNCVAIISRQNGKTLLVILRILYGLFVANDRRGERIVYSAQRWGTSEDVYRRTWAIIEVRPWLKRRIVKHTCSGSKGYLETRGGGRCAFVTRSPDLGKGFDEVDLVIYDEGYNLTGEQRAALNPTQLASKNPQTIYLSTSVDEDVMPHCDVLAGMRERGLAGEEDLYFAEWMAPADMAVDAPETWHYANPSAGVIHQDRDIREALRDARTTPERKKFELEYLGRGKWPKPEQHHVPVIEPEVWSRMLTTEATLVGPIAIAIDRTPDREWWAIAATQRTDEGKVHLEVGYFQKASVKGVLDYILDLITAWDPIVVVIDAKSTANVLKPELIDAGIEPEMTNAPQFAAACGGFLDAATGRTLSHTGIRVLDTAVDEVAKRHLSNTQFVWDNTTGAVVAPLIAATLAHWGLLTFGVMTAPRALPSTGQSSPTTTAPMTIRSARRTGELDLMSVGF